MTKKLYYDDAYIKNFEATVISCEKSGDSYLTVLDRTAFFPEEGGQYSDKGYVNGVRVCEVIIKDEVIYHRTESALVVGSKVECEIDFDDRYEKMQCHSAEHILSGLIHSKFGYNNVGFHLGAEEVTMDIDHPMTKDELLEIERLANEAIYANVDIVTSFPSKEELPTLEYRSKLDLTENVRIVNIGKYDSCACCAPHVARTGEIGLVKILDFAGLRGGIRIRIAAGRRAMRIFSSMQENLARISHITSTPKLECGEAVERISCELERVKAEYKEFRRSYFLREAEHSGGSSANLLLHYPDASMDEMRIVANFLTERVGGILVLLSGSDGNYKYVLSTGSQDLKLALKNINTALNGKGGGSANMAQGSFNSSIDEIKTYFGI